MFHQYFIEIAHNRLIIVTAIAIMLDTIFGLGRAVREHKFNSNFGIDGAIRKSLMVISVVFLMFADYVVKLNLIGFIPQELREGVGLTKVGLGEFFCILYILYEAVSILKNMYLCGLPVPAFARKKMEHLLTEMTEEIKTEETHERTD